MLGRQTTSRNCGAGREAEMQQQFRTNQDLETLLQRIFEELSVMDGDDAQHAGLDEWRPPLAGMDVHTFAEQGILTQNRGLVLRFPDGAEFQLTLVQSVRAERDGSGKDE